MERVLALEEELAYLRAVVDRHESAARAAAAELTRPAKKLVLELGANDGGWIADFCARHPVGPCSRQPLCASRLLKSRHAVGSKEAGL